MDWNLILENIWQLVLLPLLIYGTVLLKNFIDSKIKTQQVARILKQATDAASKAVGWTAQTFVDEMKKSGEWTDESAQLAFAKAMEMALSILSDEAYALLELITSDANAYLEQAIEDAIALRKLEQTKAIILDDCDDVS